MVYSRVFLERMEYRGCTGEGDHVGWGGPKVYLHGHKYAQKIKNKYCFWKLFFTIDYVFLHCITNKSQTNTFFQNLHILSTQGIAWKPTNRFLHASTILDHFASTTFFELKSADYNFVFTTLGSPATSVKVGLVWGLGERIETLGGWNNFEEGPPQMREGGGPTWAIKYLTFKRVSSYTKDTITPLKISLEIGLLLFGIGG